jgi:NAD-dependent dihydropyrimidine dehydrogenase PreA subunit
MNMITVYYFSATGNSLHIAEEFGKRMPGTSLVPIDGLSEGKHPVPEGEKIGFIFPVHINSLPKPVIRFVETTDFGPAAYLFAAATHCGYPGRMDLQLNELLRPIHRTLDAYFTFKLCLNTPKGILPSFLIDRKWTEKIGKDRIAAMDTDNEPRLDEMARIVGSGLTHLDGGKTGPAGRFLQSFLLRSAKNRKEWIGFYADSDCDGCGICEKVCLAGTVSMESRRPLWLRSVGCWYCYACFNHCPKQAILVKNYTLKTGRYLYPGTTVQKIAR